MNDQAIKEVVGLICESRHGGDMVAITIEDGQLGIQTAPSYVLDAITDNGYYISAFYGSVVVSDKEE